MLSKNVYETWYFHDFLRLKSLQNTVPEISERYKQNSKKPDFLWNVSLFILMYYAQCS